MRLTMNVTKTEMFGLVMGSIPGINIPTGFIKFFVYFNKEDEIKDKMKSRLQVDVTAGKVKAIDMPGITKSIEGEISKLKWCALLQMIPLIGIIGAIFEKEILEWVNELTDRGDLNPQDPANVKQPDLPLKKANPGQVLELSDANFQATIKKGNTMVMYVPNIDDKSTAEIKEFELAAKKMEASDVTFAKITSEAGPLAHAEFIRKGREHPTIYALYVDGGIECRTGELGSCHFESFATP